MQAIDRDCLGTSGSGWIKDNLVPILIPRPLTIFIGPGIHGTGSASTTGTGSTKTAQLLGNSSSLRSQSDLSFSRLTQRLIFNE